LEVFYYVIYEKSSKLPPPHWDASIARVSGFTLAEVLITLGIIGVVASLTLPTLIQSHRKQVVENKLQKFYSVINQAVKMSENDNGAKEMWFWQKNTTENFYNTYLKNYLDTLNTEKFSEDEMKVFFKDGTAMRLRSQGSEGINGGYVYFYTNASDLDKYVGTWDSIVNSYKSYGSRIFTFVFFPSPANNPNYKALYNKGVEPYKMFYGDECRENPYTCGSDTHLNCNPNTVGEKWFCAVIIQQNGWKIPKDYPFKL